MSASTSFTKIGPSALGQSWKSSSIRILESGVFPVLASIFPLLACLLSFLWLFRYPAWLSVCVESGMAEFHLKPEVTLNRAVSQGWLRACQNKSKHTPWLSQLASVILFHLAKLGTGPRHPRILRNGHLAATGRWLPFRQSTLQPASNLTPLRTWKISSCACQSNNGDSSM